MKKLIFGMGVLVLATLVACGGSVDTDALVDQAASAAKEVSNTAQEVAQDAIEEIEEVAEEVMEEEVMEESVEGVAGTNIYYVKNQWGGSDAAWHEAGAWVIGSRLDQPVVSLIAESSDDGQTLVGTMTYEGEGPIGFRATQTQNNTYYVENQWGGDDAPWNDGGLFLLGGRDGQNVVSINISSDDGGATLTGEMTYAGEGAIGFNGTGTPGSVYAVSNEWASDPTEHSCGLWVIGSRDGQNIVNMNIASSDDGASFNGDVVYDGEGPIGFIGNFQDGNNYVVENQWGGSDAPWHAGGTFVLGCREAQRAVEVQAASDDGGQTLEGEMIFAGEGPIAFKAQRQN